MDVVQMKSFSLRSLFSFTFTVGYHVGKWYCLLLSWNNFFSQDIFFRHYVFRQLCSALYVGEYSMFWDVLLYDSIWLIKAVLTQSIHISKISNFLMECSVSVHDSTPYEAPKIYSNVEIQLSRLHLDRRCIIRTENGWNYWKW